ncbi:MAG: MurR/RpiR family transcriptional regulator [Breznakia sp.]
MKLHINKAVFKTLSDSEKSVIEFINHNEEKLVNLSITDIAENSFTSIATVSRTIQKCGFQGISELRYFLKQENIKNNSPYIANEIIAKSYRECTESLNNIRITSILKSAEILDEAKIVYIYARGFTTLVAEEFQMQIQLLGFQTVIVKDSMWMRKTKYLVTKNDAIIVLSVANSTPELAQSAKAAKENGAKIIVCTCKDNTPLKKYADVHIIGYSEEIMKAHNIVIHSHVALFLITKIILEYLSAR